MSEQNFQMVQEFSFDLQKQVIRTMLDQTGEPWFVAKDICNVLEISNSRDAVSKLDDDEKGVALTDTLGGKQEANIVNESGLYNLIFRSDKPQAKVFRKWVTSDVLPAIRKSGHFGIPLNMQVPEDHSEALDLWVFLGKHRVTLLTRLKAVRELEKSVVIRVKQGARPYQIPLDKQIGLFAAGGLAA